MRRIFAILSILTAIVASACGTAATPVPDSDTMTLAAQESHSEEEVVEEGEEVVEEVAVEPSNTPIPPTNTPVPPTEAPTVEEPTEVPATEAPAAAEDPLVRLVNLLGDPASGETLFQTTFDTAAGQWACMQCHNNASEDRLIGPGLLNAREHAATRIEGVAPEVYVVNSILHPNDFIVPGDPEYPAGLMPQNYGEVLTEQQIYDLAAYLLSLQG